MQKHIVVENVHHNNNNSNNNENKKLCMAFVFIMLCIGMAAINAGNDGRTLLNCHVFAAANLYMLSSSPSFSSFFF